MASKALELLQRFRGLKEEGSKPKRIDEIDPLFKDEYAIGKSYIKFPPMSHNPTFTSLTRRQ